MSNKQITTLAQLRKEHKPAKAYHFTVSKDFVLILEDFNYFDEEKHDEFIDLLDKVMGNTTHTYKEIVHAGDELFKLWVGDEVYEKAKEQLSRSERISIGQLASKHFEEAHGAKDPKEK